ncbi:hypothetical protein FGO68_gene6328 [Halteria grandinella]|uniref:Uncharacterized protein n=1 Tax=Halteria grandinella TaxID=5974 RepID=A0A8J8T510_HALGN|nr:hypothetical protein FGO68_gene6328 [Halteria grandinella]
MNTSFNAAQTPLAPVREESLKAPQLPRISNIGGPKHAHSYIGALNISSAGGGNDGGDYSTQPHSLPQIQSVSKGKVALGSIFESPIPGGNRRRSNGNQQRTIQPHAFSLEKQILLYLILYLEVAIPWSMSHSCISPPQTITRICSLNSKDRVNSQTNCQTSLGMARRGSYSRIAKSCRAGACR